MVHLFASVPLTAGERLESLNHLLRLAWRKYPDESRAAVARADGEGITPLERSSWSGAHQQLQELLSPATLIGPCLSL